MMQYRFYPLDEAGRITQAPHIIEADSDTEALEKVRPLQDGYSLDGWQKARHVGLLKVDNDR